jgi:uncharacterized membrane protein
MTRDEQDRSEWSRPENWRGGWLGVYVAPRDSRVWVPKRAPWIGWTLNFAHRRSWAWLIGLIGLPAVIAMLISGSAR